MKLLLDENIPHGLRRLLVGHDVFTVTFMGWNGIENGELLSLAASQGFDGIVTKDISISYQQNIAKIPCTLIVIEAKSNELPDIAPLVPDLLKQLKTAPPCSILHIK